jgi:MFS family permease
MLVITNKCVKTNTRAMQLGNRFGRFIRIFVLAMVIAGGVLFFALGIQSLWLLASGAIAMAVALIGVVAASERVISMETGMPLQDELSRKAIWKAGYYAFVTGMWLAIGLMAGNLFAGEILKLPEINFRYAFEVLVIVPGLVFAVLAMWFKQKGSVD